MKQIGTTSELKNSVLVAIGITFLAISTVAADKNASMPAVRILIGPNILVSRDGDVPHCETMVAANPRDPKNLIGGSIVGTTDSSTFVTKPYVSSDGGARWTAINLPTGSSGDPQVGFGITGTAYFLGLNFEGMTFYRSEDGGKSWGQGVNLGKHHDHENLITDYTYGPYAGRVYITDETEVPGSNELEDLKMQRRVVLFRSSDDGRSFIGPIEVVRSENNGLSAQNLLILSDGTLLIPINEYPNYSTDKNADTWKVVFSESHDGGVTFSPLQTIGTAHFGGATALRAAQRSGQVDQVGAPVFALDRSNKFRDRIYAAWTDFDKGRFRLMLTWSTDRGKSWTTPKPVEPNAPSYASQFQPMIAVDSNGNLGIMYYDTDGFPKRDHFFVSFTASTDGGETLLPKKRLSSVASSPFGSGDLRPGAFTETDRGMVTADFISAVSRWVNGGDYIGLAASDDGLFHPFWTDARSGTYQLYTATVRVATDAAGETAAAPSGHAPADLTSKMTLAFDPVSYDAQTGEAVVPIRLKNTSSETLYPPFRVEVKEMEHPYMVKSHEPYDPPTFLNASNGKPGVGAVFDYSSALGDLPALEPNAVTDAIPWQLKAAAAVKTNFHLGVEITGYVAKPGAGTESKSGSQ